MKDLSQVPGLHMTEKNLRIALQRLVEKLSIEEAQSFDAKRKVARMWKVYTYRMILERRRAAGMEWIVRDRGVRFIDPITTPIKTTPVVMLEDITTPVNMTERTAVAMTETTPVVMDPLSLVELSSREEPERTSLLSASRVVTNAIISAFGFVDDDAISLIIRRCRDKVPDATNEEIAELATFQCRRISKMRNVDNPIGLLIDQVPRCFEGESFARYRREKAEAERRLQELYTEEESP